MYKLTQKQKRIRTVILFVILIGIMCFVKSAGSKPSLTVYVVKPDDTLWDIAYSEYGDTVDIRDYINEIECINGIEGHIIYEGDKLLLPDRVRIWKIR